MNKVLLFDVKRLIGTRSIDRKAIDRDLDSGMVASSPDETRESGWLRSVSRFG